MRRVAIITGTRADFGPYRPVLRAMMDDPELSPELFVCGAHLSPEFGHTVDEIEAEGFPVAARVPTFAGTASARDIARSMGLAVQGFAEIFARRTPDILLVLGDRYEMFAAAAAAVPFAIPIAHIHGGELTEGAIDDVFRHGLTKMSHLHFVATEVYARRVRQMGEQPDRVFVTGAPGLDNLATVARLDRGALESRLGMPLAEPPLLVTFHPATLDAGGAGQHMAELLAALENERRPIVFTYPNADVSGEAIIRAIEAFVVARNNTRAVANLGTGAYVSLMARAAAMIGNSSSGIIEAASFGLSVVNIGDRQKGRVRARNVIDVGYGREEIKAALARALSDEFRRTLADLKNPYGDGRAAARIVSVLRHTPLDSQLLKKAFHDLPTADGSPR